MAWDVLGMMLATCKFAASSGSILGEGKPAGIPPGASGEATVRVEAPLCLLNVIILERPART
jgi:hypothetical protein